MSAPIAATLRTTLLACALTAFAALPAQAASLPLESLREAVQRFEPAIVAILAVNEEGDANQGTGFIVRADGLVITCEHVIRHAETIEIHWSSQLGRASEVATVRARDARHDLALLQLPGADYPVMPLAKADDLRVGDAVAALGFPVGDILGLTDLSVTRGVISALRRNEDGQVELVQTDAPIFMGNSGGPLYDLDLGAVVGVVRAKGIEELSGINFASGLDALLRLFPEVTVEVSSPSRTTQTAQPVSPERSESPEIISALPRLFSLVTYGRLQAFVHEVRAQRRSPVAACDA